MSPAPQPLPHTEVLVLSRSSCTTSGNVSPGSTLSMSATSPLTCGVAIEVPCENWYIDSAAAVQHGAEHAVRVAAASPGEAGVQVSAGRHDVHFRSVVGVGAAGCPYRWPDGDHAGAVGGEDAAGVDVVVAGSDHRDDAAGRQVGEQAVITAEHVAAAGTEARSRLRFRTFAGLGFTGAPLTFSPAAQRMPSSMSNGPVAVAPQIPVPVRG